ncbi:hypothetical protein SAMN05216413_0990 [Ruminococcaceae bacterium KH2T8]|nr:hypothetical protein SAMN05216413_0990 [Ruminococcaceae bacterium KH2T8]
MYNEAMNIKDHICPSCGGTLHVDIARQMYECPFCGMTFDYDYFREENVLEIADKSLNAGETYSARQAYEFMLSKEPDNFLALRGLSLVSMKLKRVEEMRMLESYRGINLDSAHKSLDRAIDATKPENKEYFVLMNDMLCAGERYYREEKAIEHERKERTRFSDAMNRLVTERDDLQSAQTEGASITPKDIRVVCTALFLIWAFVISMIFIAYHFYNPYTKEHYEYVTATMETTRYNSMGNIDISAIQTRNSTSGQDEVNPFEVYVRSQSETRREREEAERKQIEEIREAQREEEEERVEKEEQWAEDHKKDIPNLIMSIGIPAIALAAVRTVLGKRDARYNVQIDEIQKNIDALSAQIKMHQDEQLRCKNTIAMDYKDLIKIEPVL